MKKFLALLMTVLVMVGATALAASAANSVLSTESQTVNTGDSVEVSVKLETAGNAVYCIEYWLTYDAEILSLETVEQNEAFGLGVYNSDEAGVIQAKYANSDIASDGVTLTATFKAVAPGDAKLALSEIMLAGFDEEYNDIYFDADLNVGTVTVEGEAVSGAVSEESSETESTEPTQSTESTDASAPTDESVVSDETSADASGEASVDASEESGETSDVETDANANDNWFANYWWILAIVAVVIVAAVVVVIVMAKKKPADKAE